MKKLYLLALTLFAFSSFAQNYTFTQYNTNNSGIGFNAVSDIKTDASGALWLVSNFNSGANGIAKFDGTTWTNYNTTNSSIPSDLVVDLEIDGQNRKWIGTYQNGISVFNGTTWTNYTTSNSGLPSNSIKDLAIDGQGIVWIGSNAGLTKFNGSTWVTYNTSNSNLFSNGIVSVAVNSSNVVYIADGAALSKFNGSSFNIITDGAKNIAKIVGNTIYMTTYSGYAKLVNENTAANYSYEDNSCLMDCQLEGLDIDENDNIWLGFYSECSSGGLQNFTTCTNYTNLSTNIEGLATIGALKVQNSNTIWIGSLYSGLIKMSRSTSNCNPPTQFWSENITAASATLNWNPSTSAPNGGYLYVYNTTNEIGGTDGSSTSTSASIDGLSPNTDYHWWVASVCGNDQSEWVYGGYFTTLQSTATCWQKVSSGQQFTVAIKGDGTLWSWGANAYGQLGYPTTSNINTPTQVGTAANWKSISCGVAHTLAIKTDGTLWAWGNNFYGYLGDGTTVAKNTPVQIGTATNWEKVTAGNTHSFGIKTDGTLWAWGYNTYGQLGNGNTSNRSVPTQIGTATDWKNIGAGNSHSIGIKTNGTLWTWGRNDKGQLGDGTATNKNAPTQIGTATNWLNADGGISYTVATKTTGTLWAWGENTYGQLGQNDIVNRNTPTQVGTATTWDLVSAGGGHVIASRNYGALFAWGSNDSGQLGNGTTTDVLVPTLLFNETGWTAVNAGFDFSTALASTGSVFTWGNNSLGQLGNGTSVNDINAYGSLPCPSLSVEEPLFMSDLKAYPNPVAGVLNIAASQTITSLSVYTILGQEVATKQLNAKEGTIDLAHLNPGYYFVKIQSDNQVNTVRIIKK